MYIRDMLFIKQYLHHFRIYIVIFTVMILIDVMFATGSCVIRNQYVFIASKRLDTKLIVDNGVS